MTSQNILSCKFTKNKSNVTFYYKVGQALLQSEVGITNWDNIHYKVERVIPKGDSFYYKVETVVKLGQLLQSKAVQLITIQITLRILNDNDSK